MVKYSIGFVLIVLVLGLLIGAVIYPVGLLLLGIIGPDERKVLGNILPESIASRLNLN